MTKQQQAKAAKLVILVRYIVKRAATIDGIHYPAGCVVLKVRNGEGRDYYVTLRRNKIHHCSCPHVASAKCPECYHLIVCKRIENARARAAKKAALVPVALQEVQNVLLLPERCESLKYSLKQEGLVQAPNGQWLTPEQLANVPGAPRSIYEAAHAQQRTDYGDDTQKIVERLSRMGFMRR